MARTVNASRSGRRPTRSDRAPITGSQNRFEAPTHRVTISESREESCKTCLPKVGVLGVNVVNLNGRLIIKNLPVRNRSQFWEMDGKDLAIPWLLLVA